MTRIDHQDQAFDLNLNIHDDRFASFKRRYYTQEIDSFSRAHQRHVLKCFKSLTLSIVSGLRPPDDCNYWFFGSMAVAEALKA